MIWGLLTYPFLFAMNGLYTAIWTNIQWVSPIDDSFILRQNLSAMEKQDESSYEQDSEEKREEKKNEEGEEKEKKKKENKKEELAKELSNHILNLGDIQNKHSQSMIKNESQDMQTYSWNY